MDHRQHCYLICFEPDRIKPRTAAIDELDGHIRAAFATTWHGFANLWLVRADGPADLVRDQLTPVRPGDRLLVVRIEEDAAWSEFPPPMAEWLTEHV
jgi:hypothetical protein